MRGGKRKGAGRKKGFSAKTAEEAKRFLAERVSKEIGPISEALITKAKNGDIMATRELFDRSWGKAPQAVSIDANIFNFSAEKMREVRERYKVE